MSYYTESGRSAEFERIIRDILEKNGLREGDQVPPELAHKISGEVAFRAAMHQFGLPFEEKVMVSELLPRHQGRRMLERRSYALECDCPSERPKPRTNRLLLALHDPLAVLLTK
jgi:hypothetical protein